MFLNARDVLVIEHTEMGPVTNWELSRPKLAAAIPSTFDGVAVITGFVAADKDGLPTTLGRNGSDYSASIFGALLDADEVHIWTDVDGVMSGDPRQVPEAKIIDEMSYSEAMELAYFGAKVIHPQTMAPAVGRGIPLWIRNTFNATHPGTKISASSGSRAAAVKGISGVDKVALVNLEGAGMIGVPGTADRLFGALRDAGVSVMLISQGSSEHSICFAVREEAAEQVRAVVERAFAVELSEGQVQRVGVTKSCAIVAVVGDDMAGLPGSAAVLRHPGHRRDQRSRDRAGSFRAQHLGRHRRQGHDAGDPGGALELLLVGEDRIDRRARPRARRRDAARPARTRRSDAAHQVQPGSALARDRRQQEDGARRAGASISPSGAPRSRRASQWTARSSSRTFRPITCRTRCSIDCTANQSVADRYGDWFGRGHSRRSRRTSALTAGLSRITRT